jgi:hypothetical protein
MSTSPDKKPTQLKLVTNDLDFHYLPARASLAATAHVDLVCTVDCAQFFSKAAHHMVFALDCVGEQGSYNPHCGPILRHGANLFSEARGFILFADGAVEAERWNGTAMPVVVAVDNTSGTVFQPAAHPIFTVHIQAGYRAGAYANRMLITIHQGITIDGPVMFKGEIAGTGWGWDWSGTHRAAVGGIALGFVAPSATGCVEEVLPRSAPESVLPFVGFELRVVGS